MFRLDTLVSTTKKRKRVGRGGSRGGQSGRGHKGQRARSGGKSEIHAAFEGGQMPLARRLPRRGFTNPFKQIFAIFNLDDLEIRFADGEQVNEQTLREKNLIKGKKKLQVKILGKGSLTKKLVVSVDALSKSAAAAISSVGGQVHRVSEGEKE